MNRDSKSFKATKEPKLSRTHAPTGLAPLDWQRGLRRQFGGEQRFVLENLQGKPFFSEFRVSNPESKSNYRVAIRGVRPGDNFCACPDQNLLVPMTAMQMTYHDENADIVAKIVKRWRKLRFLSDQDQRRLTCALQNMRMSCNSTYLLDQETDHGVKVDELAALLDGLFVQPGAKAVVFSQWTRTHEIVIRRLKERRIGYVSFHGGVPSEQRPALVERFRDDRDCRVFLSTDAGSTGLNLQHASTLVNMDLPWNPAVLEQRIGRIHRMGQRNPVQIVNYVSKGTIEEGMLSVLAFKRSLSAGILDGGTGEISLGGSRLNRFMKDVEAVTGRMGEGEAMVSAEEAVNVAALAEETPASAAMEAHVDLSGTRPIPTTETRPQQSGIEPWRGLLQFGAELVSALVAPDNGVAAAHPWVERDPATGARSLKVSLPPPETVKPLADALLAFSNALLRKGSENDRAASAR